MRIRLTVHRAGLTPAKLLWPVTELIATDPSARVSTLLSAINEAVPLEVSNWGLEDYTVEIGGYELLHFQKLREVLKEDDEIVVRPLAGAEVRERVRSGRRQITDGGKRLIDGVAYGRAWVRRDNSRPEIEATPRKRLKLEEGYHRQYDDEDEEEESEGEDFTPDSESECEAAELEAMKAITEKGEIFDDFSADDKSEDKEMGDQSSSDSESSDIESEGTESEGEDLEDELKDLLEDAEDLNGGRAKTRHKESRGESGSECESNKSSSTVSGDVGGVNLKGEDAKRSSRSFSSSNPSDSSESESSSEEDNVMAAKPFGIIAGATWKRSLTAPRLMISDSESDAEKSSSEEDGEDESSSSSESSDSDSDSDDDSDSDSDSDSDDSDSSDSSDSSESSEDSESSDSFDDSEGVVASDSSDSPSSDSSSDSESEKSEDESDGKVKKVKGSPTVDELSAKHSNQNGDAKTQQQKTKPPGSGSSKTRARNLRRKLLKERRAQEAATKTGNSQNTNTEPEVDTQSELEKQRQPGFGSFSSTSAHESQPQDAPLEMPATAKSADSSIAESISEYNRLSETAQREGITKAQFFAKHAGLAKNKKKGFLDHMWNKRALHQKFDDDDKPVDVTSEDKENGDSWRDSISISAVECGDSTTGPRKLPTPPFPFQHPYTLLEAQEQNSRKRKRSTTINANRQLKAPRQSQRHFSPNDEEPDYTADMYDDAPVIKESQEPDLPELPKDMSTLPALALPLLPGTIIAFKQLTMDEYTMEPILKDYRTALVEEVNEYDEVTLRLAKRDWPKKKIDPYTGEVIRSKFSLDLDEDGQNEGEMILNVGELLEAKIVKMPKDAAKTVEDVQMEDKGPGNGENEDGKGPGPTKNADALEKERSGPEESSDIQMGEAGKEIPQTENEAPKEATEQVDAFQSNVSTENSINAVHDSFQDAQRVDWSINTTASLSQTNATPSNQVLEKESEVEADYAVQGNSEQNEIEWEPSQLEAGVSGMGAERKPPPESRDDKSVEVTVAEKKSHEVSEESSTTHEQAVAPVQDAVVISESKAPTPDVSTTDTDQAAALPTLNIPLNPTTIHTLTTSPSASVEPTARELEKARIQREKEAEEAQKDFIAFDWGEESDEEDRETQVESGTPEEEAEPDQFEKVDEPVGAGPVDEEVGAEVEPDQFEKTDEPVGVDPDAEGQSESTPLTSALEAALAKGVSPKANREEENRSVDVPETTVKRHGPSPSEGTPKRCASVEATMSGALLTPPPPKPVFEPELRHSFVSKLAPRMVKSQAALGTNANGISVSSSKAGEASVEASCAPTPEAPVPEPFTAQLDGDDDVDMDQDDEDADSDSASVVSDTIIAAQQLEVEMVDTMVEEAKSATLKNDLDRSATMDNDVPIVRKTPDVVYPVVEEGDSQESTKVVPETQTQEDTAATFSDNAVVEDRDPPGGTLATENTTYTKSPLHGQQESPSDTPDRDNKDKEVIFPHREDQKEDEVEQYMPGQSFLSSPLASREPTPAVASASASAEPEKPEQPLVRSEHRLNGTPDTEPAISSQLSGLLGGIQSVLAVAKEPQFWIGKKNGDDRDEVAEREVEMSDVAGTTEGQVPLSAQMPPIEQTPKEATPAPAQTTRAVPDNEKSVSLVAAQKTTRTEELRWSPSTTAESPTPVSIQSKATTIPKGTGKSLSGLSFCFTGQLPTLSREQIQTLVKQEGGVYAPVPNRKTDYVVVGEKVTPKKVQVIRTYGLKTLTEDEFFDLIHARSSAEKKAEAREAVKTLSTPAPAPAAASSAHNVAQIPTASQIPSSSQPKMRSSKIIVAELESSSEEENEEDGEGQEDAMRRKASEKEKDLPGSDSATDDSSDSIESLEAMFSQASQRRLSMDANSRNRSQSTVNEKGKQSDAQQQQKIFGSNDDVLAREKKLREEHQLREKRAKAEMQKLKAANSKFANDKLKSLKMAVLGGSREVKKEIIEEASDKNSLYSIPSSSQPVTKSSIPPSSQPAPQKRTTWNTPLRNTFSNPPGLNKPNRQGSPTQNTSRLSSHSRTEPVPDSFDNIPSTAPPAPGRPVVSKKEPIVVDLTFSSDDDIPELEDMDEPPQNTRAIPIKQEKFVNPMQKYGSAARGRSTTGEQRRSSTGSTKATGAKWRAVSSSQK